MRNILTPKLPDTGTSGAAMPAAPLPWGAVRSGSWGYWGGRLAASDPGAQRFRAALQAVVTVAAAIGVEWCFVQFTHALQMPTGHGVSAAAAAQVAAQRHGVLIVAMLFG